jgi:hypothetical protein
MRSATNHSFFPSRISYHRESLKTLIAETSNKKKISHRWLNRAWIERILIMEK